MRLLYVELAPGFTRSDILDRIRMLYGKLSYENLEVGFLTRGGNGLVLEKLGREGSTVSSSRSLGELVKEFFHDCKTIHVLREDGAVSKPVEDCFISGVHTDPPEELEQVLTTLSYTVLKTSLGPTPYLASSLIPILYRLKSLEHIFNMFTV
ncbi:hypothetical protein IMZ38_00845 [Thermosphaera chiliense]|uniref:Uncharacterized protein n=1 Tax=Thermosphaera chiliense TaxID=3402707 RepID=A0A7M1UQK9_9CREN|nr:hypothetical protein [Thermosphaera aggregans]QOR94530.1 hypothetical protein IMZ38_00845 [Thermosphaera aggregans]